MRAITKEQIDARRRILALLDASRPFLDQATAWEIAIELVVQGLDIVPEQLRGHIIAAAIEQLDVDVV